MELLIIIALSIALVISRKKIASLNEELEQQEQWMIRHTPMATQAQESDVRQVYEGEVMEPDYVSPPRFVGSHYPRDSNWKAKAAIIGVQLLVGALVGHRKHHHRRHDNYGS